MEAPNVVAFSNDGQHIICGGFHTDRTLHVFDTTIPGRDSTIFRLGKTRRSSDGQKGLISSICFGGGTSLSSSIIAVGTYSPGSIYLYDLRSPHQPSGTILNGHCMVGHGKGHARKKRRFVKITKGKDVNLDEIDENDENWFTAAKGKWFQSKTQSGVTQLQFAPNDEYILYSSSRRSNVIIAWDTRMLSGQSEFQSNPIRGLSSYATMNDTNQRLEFDIDPTGQTMFVGGQDHCVRIYDVKSGKCTDRISDLGDVANGVSFSSTNGRSLVAIATGSRRFASLDDDYHDDNEALIDPPGYLRLYDYKKREG
jgi:telomerase Cajal body protein 1